MKILLVGLNAKYIHSNPALYELRAYAKEFQDDISLMEFTINHKTDDLLKGIFEEKPDVAAFSCYIWNIDYIEKLLPDLAKILPNTKWWLGGPEVSYDARICMERCPSVHGIMVGEGEDTFLELASHFILKDRDLSSIKGIVYRTIDGAIVLNPERAAVPFQTLPFPYASVKDFENRIVYYETSRGCPYHCSYCLSSVDKKLRFRDLGLVFQELEFFLRNRVPQVKFIDRTFNCSREHALAVWRYIKEHDNGFTNFHFEIAAELLQAEETELLQSMRAGQVQLEIGVQTVNPQTLMEINRQADTGRLAEKVEELRKNANMHLHLDLIAGLPFEDLESFRSSFDTVYRMRPQELQLGFLKVLKGTLMESRCCEYGLQFQEKPPYEVLSTKWLGYQDILELKLVEEMLEVYGNSGQFRHSMEFLEHYYDGPYAVYLALGRYYKRNGLLKPAHDRLRRYEILLEFVRTELSMAADTFQSLLIFDFYLRDNRKERPAFAEDTGKWKAVYRRFFESGAFLEFLPDYKEMKPAQAARMVHLEPAVWEAEESASLKKDARLKKGAAVRGHYLFDYKKRDPLYHNAAVILIPAEIMEV